MIDENEDIKPAKAIFIMATQGDNYTYSYNYCGMDRLELVGLLESIKLKECP